MIKKTGLVFAILLYFNAAFGQVGIKFETTSHSFGKIREIDGAAECIFRFKNSGNEALIIQNVKASCGCTVPEWPKEPISPGDTGIIKAIFNTNNRPGGFNKSITVVANTEPSTHVLTFSGFVIAKQQTINEGFPYQSGMLRFSTDSINFGTVSIGEEFAKQVEVYNAGNQKISFSQPETPKHIRIEYSTAVLEPGALGIVSFIYSPALKNEYGEVSDEFVLVTNDEENKKKQFKIAAEIIDAKVKVTSEPIAKNEGLKISTTAILLDTVKAGEIINKEFEIKNTGKEDRQIRKISTPGHIKIDQNKAVALKPGQKLKVKISYNSKGKVGVESSFIKIYSDDPETPVISIPVKGEVIKK